jgi:hypothetical protein
MNADTSTDTSTNTSTDTSNNTNKQPSNRPAMKRLLKATAVLLLCGAVLSALLIGAALQSSEWLDGASVVINGDALSMAEMHAGHWLLAMGAVVLSLLLVMLIVLLVVPFAVIVPLLCAALGISVALLMLLGVAAFLLSPLLLLGWIVWRLLRSPSAARQPGATMVA